MENIEKYQEIEERIIRLRGENVLLDSDVAALYGVETKRVNEAVKNNPDKFPFGYLFELDKFEKKELVENFDRFNRLKHSSVNPIAFTERGLYMLATILKSPLAVKTTISIIDTFTQIRELARTVEKLQDEKNAHEQQKLLKQSGELMADVIGKNLNTTATETEIELNFAVVKIKHVIKRGENK